MNNELTDVCFHLCLNPFKETNISASHKEMIIAAYKITWARSS
jgi:hypothetical protein